jgi:hypothetical protein
MYVQDMFAHMLHVHALSASICFALLCFVYMYIHVL